MRVALTVVSLSLLLALHLALAGCGERRAGRSGPTTGASRQAGNAADSTNTAASATPATSSGGAPAVSPFPATEQMEIVLYFPRRDGQGLVRETRTVSRRGEQPEMVVLAEFLRGPTSPEARPAFPPAAPRDYGLKVFDGRAAVWLPAQALKAAAERQDTWAVRALVETLGQSARVRELQITTDATGPKRIGDIDLGQPLKPGGAS